MAPLQGADETVSTVRWLYKGRTVNGYEQLLGCYADKEFDSPRRSTIPLLVCWRNPQPRIRELSKVLDFPQCDWISLDFEHMVGVQRGKGKASYTDLMLTSGDTSFAIEAKWTEPRYEDVAAWLCGGASRLNRIEVLKGWLELLGRNCLDNLSVAAVLELPYQLVHRAASACSPDTATRWLIYQLFDVDPAKHEMYVNDLRRLANVLGLDRTLRICAASYRIERTERQIQLEHEWFELRERCLGVHVRADLSHDNLFSVWLENCEII